MRTTTASGKTVSTNPGEKPSDYPLDVSIEILFFVLFEFIFVFQSVSISPGEKPTPLDVPYHFMCIVQGGVYRETGHKGDTEVCKGDQVLISFMEFRDVLQRPSTNDPKVRVERFSVSILDP